MGLKPADFELIFGADKERRLSKAPKAPPADPRFGRRASDSEPSLRPAAAARLTLHPCQLRPGIPGRRRVPAAGPGGACGKIVFTSAEAAPEKARPAASNAPDNPNLIMPQISLAKQTQSGACPLFLKLS